MISHDKIWGIVEFQKNCRFSFEGTQIILILCSESTTGRYREDQIRASHQEQMRSKFLYIHFIHLKEFFHTNTIQKQYLYPEASISEPNETFRRR